MGIIHQMDEALATRIAAGEVVERPASVVKELVENAIDAGATTVDVSIEDGGLHSIRVADDGCGMDEEDARLCLSRHATSKVRSVHDLDFIATLGFRGEALAAIASVARVRIETRRQNDDVGTEVIAGDAAVLDVAPTARRPGTTITVRSLFHNTPARRRFVGTPRAEAGRVLRTLQAAAIANPELTFSLTIDGEERVRYSGTASLLERITQVHGEAFAATLIEVSGARDVVTVQGYITRPADAVRSSRRSSLALNGRPVDDYVLRGVVSRAMGQTIPNGLRAEVIIDARIPAGAVDVNVSPDKSKVRYRQGMEALLWGAVSDAVKGALADERSVAELSAPREDFETPAPINSSPVARVQDQTRGDQLGSEDQPEKLPGLFGEDDTAENTTPRHGIPESPATIQQLANTFLVTVTDKGMLVVDQHSAHERVLYEQLRDAWLAETEPASLDLLVPQVFEVNAEDRILLEEMEPFLQKVGFDVAPAGPAEFWIQAVPARLGRRDPLRVLKALMEDFRAAQNRGLEGATNDELPAMYDRMLMTAACKAAIKSGESLTETEMRALWRDLCRADLGLHDVHGRPGVILIPHSEIFRRFGRSSISFS